MKKLFLALLISGSVFAQEVDLKASIGYKAIEVGLSKTLEGTELIFGGAIAFSDPQQIEKRSNQFNQTHSIQDEIIYSGFGLLGAKFERLNLIGKLGACYINKQDVTENYKTEPYDNRIFFAIGMNVMYRFSNKIGGSVSYDNVNAAMVGISYVL